MSPSACLQQTTDQADLRRAFGCFPSGVAAVCANVDGTPTGMAVSSFTSVSLDPPLVSICAAHTSSTWPILRRAVTLGVSILGADHDSACRQLSSKAGDRFAGLSIDYSGQGAGFLDGAVARLECSIEEEIRAGDHDIVLLRVRALCASPDHEPLVFHASRFHRLAEPPASRPN